MFDDAIATAAFDVNPGRGSVMDVAAAHGEVGCVHVVNAFGIEVAAPRRGLSGVVNFAVEDGNVGASGRKFNAVAPGVVDFAIAHRDVARAASLGKGTKYPIPVGLELDAIVISTDDFEAFGCRRWFRVRCTKCRH